MTCAELKDFFTSCLLADETEEAQDLAASQASAATSKLEGLWDRVAQVALRPFSIVDRRPRTNSILA
eukprot:SAG31_NODE_1162_length_9594_cov_3.045498_5_plen_67_part_00